MLPAEETFLIGSMGARILGRTKDEEDVMLDYISMELIIGDKAGTPIIGPSVSMLRSLGEEEMHGAIGGILNSPPDTGPGYSLKESKFPAPIGYMGHRFSPPVDIPIRQTFQVDVEVSQSLLVPVELRIYLFGLQTKPSYVQ